MCCAAQMLGAELSHWVETVLNTSVKLIAVIFAWCASTTHTFAFTLTFVSHSLTPALTRVSTLTFTPRLSLTLIHHPRLELQVPANGYLRLLLCHPRRSHVRARLLRNCGPAWVVGLCRVVSFLIPFKQTSSLSTFLPPDPLLFPSLGNLVAFCARSRLPFSFSPSLPTPSLAGSCTRIPGVVKPFHPDTSFLDEIIGYALGAAGFIWQLTTQFGLGFPLNIVRSLISPLLAVRSDPYICFSSSICYAGSPPLGNCRVVPSLAGSC